MTVLNTLIGFTVLAGVARIIQTFSQDYGFGVAMVYVILITLSLSLRDKED